MTDDLITFLRARYDEDEQAARKAAALCGCHPPAKSWTFGDEETGGRILVVDDPHPDLKRELGRRWNGSYQGLFVAQHIARHGPARVLADIDSKLRILEACEPELIDVTPTCRHPDAPRETIPGARALWGLPVLRLLALPYADHPDYRPEWRPQP